MKTPMQEVYENFNLMSDADFKAWMLNTDLLGKEKEVIDEAYLEGFNAGDGGFYFEDNYYNETFNTKER